MKYNEKYVCQTKTEPFEVQEMNTGEVVELHYLNDQPFFYECISKNRYSIWASIDGKKYNLYVEKGYYEIAQDLFTKQVNNIWMEFWAIVDRIRKKYIFGVLLPGVVVLFATTITLIVLFPKQQWIIFVALFVSLILSLFANSFLSKKLQIENLNAANRVKESIGAAQFDDIIKNQNKYIEDFSEEYYKKLEAEYAEADKKNEEPAEEVNELVEETKETTEETDIEENK